jgi:hypothetical protein
MTAPQSPPQDPEPPKNGGENQFYHEWDLITSTTFLRALLREFPFAERKGERLRPDENCRSMAVQVAAMIAQFCVNLLPDGASRMGFIFNANSQRSGKSLLAKVAIVPIYGRFVAQSWHAKEEEQVKRIDAAIISASNYICFDNVRGYLSSQALEALLTTPFWEARILGSSEIVTAPNKISLFVTGNDLMVSPDLAHRFLFCDLQVSEGDVQERKPSFVLDDSWLMQRENRIDILSAIWGCVRSWHEAGRPPASSFGFKPKLGFEQWGEMVGGIVAHAGFGNCLEAPQLAVGGNNEDRQIRDLFTVLMENMFTQRREFTFQEVVNAAHENDLFSWLLDGRMSDGDFALSAKAKSSFGLMLGRYGPNVDLRARPRSFRLASGASILFGSSGKGRNKRFFIELPEEESTVEVQKE